MLNDIRWPLTRLKPWYPGQFGVPGSDVTQGLRLSPTSKVWYVDYEHVEANDLNDGTDPDRPLKTIQAAVDKPLSNYDVIFVRSINPNGESVVTPLSINAAAGVTLLGGGPSAFYPEWKSADADTPCLTLQANGWRVSGFGFSVPAASAAIRVVGGYSYVISRSAIDHNVFWGDAYETSGPGILLESCAYPCIEHNAFWGMSERERTGAGIKAVGNELYGAAFANILNNVFTFCDNGILGEFVYSLIAGNYFIENYVYIDTSIGMGNVVTGNYIGTTDYTTDTCQGSATDTWFGNFVADTSVAEVGDNGITIAPPAPPAGP